MNEPDSYAPFQLGWSADYEDRARKRWQDSGRYPLVSRSVLDADPVPPPKAISLDRCAITWMDQGPVGSCFGNAATQAMEIGVGAAVLSGEPIEPHRLSRWMAWYGGRKKDGSIGNGQDGGTINGVLESLHEFGLCREETAPYKPSNRYLDSELPAAAWEEGKANRVTGILPFKADDADGQKRAITNGLPIVPGIWWPSGWDGRNIDQYGRTTAIGDGGFGHALVKVGYAEPGVLDDKYLWWEYCNSHGPIYPPLPAHWAERIPGYAVAPCGKSYTFWVRADLEAHVMSGYYELIGITGIAGLKQRNLYRWRDGFA